MSTLVDDATMDLAIGHQNSQLLSDAPRFGSSWQSGMILDRLRSFPLCPRATVPQLHAESSQ